MTAEGLQSMISREARSELTAYHLRLAQLEQADRDLARYAPGTAPQRVLDLRTQRSDAYHEHHFNLLTTDLSDRVQDRHRLPDCAVAVALPAMAGVSEAPGAPADGRITTVATGPGTVSIMGDLRNASDEEQWWVANWHSWVYFPAQPVTGTLSYRFTLRADLIGIPASAVFGSLRASLTLTTVADVTRPQPVITGSYWPVDETLPLTPEAKARLGRNLVVTGSIAMTRDCPAALDLTFIDIISIASGEVNLSRGEASFAVYNGTQQSADSVGRVDYCFDPEWWLKAVSDRAEFDRRPLPFP